VRFLYWNLHQKNQIEQYINDISKVHEIDVLIFSEYNLESYSLLNLLNTEAKQNYGLFTGPNFEEPKIISRLPRNSIKYIYSSKNISAVNISPPIGINISLVIVHLPSKAFKSDLDQAFLATRLPHTIRKIEKNMGHDRTIIVGDFNMNPFEAGVIASEGLHSIMDRNVARRGSRRVSGKDTPFFYNPMWSHFGDLSSGPPGTYYFDKSSNPINFYWNMFDQVMIRPRLIDNFISNDLEILSSVGDISFLRDSGVPDSINFSDHLPIKFSISTI